MRGFMIPKQKAWMLLQQYKLDWARTGTEKWGFVLGRGWHWRHLTLDEGSKDEPLITR